MNTDADGVGGAEGAKDQSKVCAFVGQGLKFVKTCPAVGGGDGFCAQASNEVFFAAAVFDELRHSADFQAVAGGEFFELGKPCHGAVGGEDFADDAGGGQTGEAGKVYCGFGVAGALKDTARLGDEGEDMAGANEI